MVLVCRKPGSARWSEEELRLLERLWADGLPKGEISARLGLSGVRSLERAITRLRQSGRARLPVRRAGRVGGPLHLAADARGLDVAELMARIRAVLTADGAALIDAVLDDGITTPGAPDDNRQGGAA